MPTKAEALAELARRGYSVAPTAKLNPQEEKQLGEARSSANMFADVTAQAQQFGKLNEKTGTGPVYAIPGMKTVGSFFNPNLARMQALTARMAPQQRVPGSGTTSDRDLALFLQAVPSVDRMGSGNAGVIEDMESMTKKRQAHAYFLDRYAQQNGTLKGGEEAFARYWQQQQQQSKPSTPARARPSLGQIFGTP